MESTFVTEIQIQNVRHLSQITIPLSKEKRKHLIITGKNGSGKTSVLEALKDFFQFVVSSDFALQDELKELSDRWKKKALERGGSEQERRKKSADNRNIMFYEEKLSNWRKAVAVCNSYVTLREKYEKGKFVLAFYQATRKSQVQISSNIERVDLALKYQIQDNPGQKLIKYMVNLKTTQAFALQRKNMERADDIERWFERFQKILRKIFEDDDLVLDFNIDTFEFQILATGRQPFNFNEMSSGYAAVFDIINDLIIRMEAQKNYNLEGVVLIDEVETHLHLELQKQILPILTELFPNLQFVVSTHSPFILSSLENAVIYDLENRTIVENGLAKLPYEGIVEGYFGAKTMSNEVQENYQRYKNLVSKKDEELSDDDFAEIDRLEVYLDEIPDFLASNMAAEYSRLKLEFGNRF